MTEGIEIQTVPELVKHIIDHWEKEKKESLAAETEQRKKLTIEIQKEQSLEKKLKESRSIAKKMELEYMQLEARIEGEKKSMIEIRSLKEEDVKSGKITLSEFYKMGKTKDQVYAETVKETMKELEQGLKAARAKRLEILNFEKELLETQTKIRYLIIEPGRILQRSLKDLAQFAEREIGHFLEEVHSSKHQLEQVKGQLLLTEGKSLGPGYSWSRLTIEQAKRLQFSPLLPLECIAALKSKLQSYKNGDIVNVTFFLRTKGIDVTPIGGKK